MKVWLVYRTDEIGYDEYDSHVVVAEDEAEVKRILDEEFYCAEVWSRGWWCDGKPTDEQIEFKELDLTVASHVMSSFNAG